MSNAYLDAQDRRSSSKVFYALRRTKSIGDRRTLTMTAQLYSLGEQAPYFTITAEERNLRRSGDNQVEACGCMHDEIVEHWPGMAPLVAVHLSDENGVPMHAIANAVYWLGFSSMKPDNDYGRRRLSTDISGRVWAPETAAEHLRVSLEEIESIRKDVLARRQITADTTAESLEHVLHSRDIYGRWAEQAAAAKALMNKVGE